MYTTSDIKNLQTATSLLLKNETMSVDELRNVLRFHEYRYYILNEPLITDNEYDRLFKRLEKLEKEDPSLITPDSPTQRVGSSLNSEFITVPHLVSMLSLENSYNPDDLIAWDNRLKTFADHQHITFSA